MSLSLGLALGLARQKRHKKKAKSFVLTNNTVSDQPTKRIQFNAPVLVRTTGNTVLGNIMLDADGTVGSISPADGWVMVRNTATTYQQFTLAGVGTVEFQDAKKVSYLSLGGALISVSGDIGKLTQLTYLYLSGALISVSGDIGKLTQLTYLSLNGSNLMTVSGSINSLLLTYLWLQTVPNCIVSGDISGNNLESIYLAHTASNIYGSLPVNKITDWLAITSTANTPLQRISIPDGFYIKSITHNTRGLRIIAPIFLPAIESKRIILAAGELASSGRQWDSTFFNISGADPTDPPGSPDPAAGNYDPEIGTAILAINNASKDITVPAAWGWSAYLASIKP